MQGAVREHLAALERCGAQGRVVRTPEELGQVQGLIIPGGESTTIGKLMHRWGLDHAIRERAAQGMPVFGTCAGMILLAKEIEGSDQHRLGLMDIAVRRNAFGRQIDSFEAPLPIPALGEPDFPAVFIRAPQFATLQPAVERLAEMDGHPVLARQGHLLAGAFHPELTRDLRLHRYFLGMVASASAHNRLAG